MPGSPDDVHTRARTGGFSIACRILGVGLAAAPLLDYLSTIARGGNGDAYRFLILLVLAAIAGVMLIANSLYRLVRYREIEPAWVNVLFIMAGLAGLGEAWYFLPQFRM
jgi:hypothetical protein